MPSEYGQDGEYHHKERDALCVVSILFLSARLLISLRSEASRKARRRRRRQSSQECRPRVVCCLIFSYLVVGMEQIDAIPWRCSAFVPKLGRSVAVVVPRNNRKSGKRKTKKRFSHSLATMRKWRERERARQRKIVYVLCLSDWKIYPFFLPPVGSPASPRTITLERDEDGAKDIYI